MSPKLSNGKICYVEIPATDIARSAEFYNRVFGWQTRTRPNGSVAVRFRTPSSHFWTGSAPPSQNLLMF